MNAKEIAETLVSWCNNGDYDRCYTELYSPKAVSIEPEWAKNPKAEGMQEIAKKGAWWEKTFEVHSSKASRPIVASNWFSVRFDMDTTHKPSGHRSQTSEIAVYQVKDGKIVQEQFFYDQD